MSIISVGYTMNFSACRDELINNLSNILSKKLVNVDIIKTYIIPDVVHSGVWYNQYAKQIYDQRSTQTDMKIWYTKHIDIDKIFIRAFYATSKVLLLEGYCGNDNFFIVASNMTKGTATTLHKKNALSGQYGPRYEIERFDISAKAYIHYDS